VAGTVRKSNKPTQVKLEEATKGDCYKSKKQQNENGTARKSNEPRIADIEKATSETVTNQKSNKSRHGTHRKNTTARQIHCEKSPQLEWYRTKKLQSETDAY